MQSGKSYAAAAARKPNAQAGAKTTNSNGNAPLGSKPAPASNKKKYVGGWRMLFIAVAVLIAYLSCVVAVTWRRSAGESKGKPSGKDTPPAAPPGFAAPKQPTVGFSGASSYLRALAWAGLACYARVCGSHLCDMRFFVWRVQTSSSAFFATARSLRSASLSYV